MNRVADMEVSCFRCRINIVRYRMLITYTVSKVFLSQILTFDIEGHGIIYRIRYCIRYNIHPMSFTRERKLPFSGKITKRYLLKPIIPIITKGLCFISYCQRRKEGTFCASGLLAGIEPTPARSVRAGYASLNLSATAGIT
jgi:hypothetical protein